MLIAAVASTMGYAYAFPNGPITVVVG